MSELRQRQAEVSTQHTEVTSALHKQSEELQQVRISFIQRETHSSLCEGHRQWSI